MDLHTHSVASGHAYSTINEICEAARDRGLQAVAVTDHGPTLSGAPDLQYFGNLRVLPADVCGARLLTGVEANATRAGNGLDIPDRLLGDLDIVGVGLHPTPDVDPADREANTEALVRALRNPMVDVLTHPGRGAWLIDVERVAAAAAEAGVAVEFNNHSFWRAERTGADVAQELAFLRLAVEAVCPVSICSDAHYETRVGVFDAALTVAAELGVPEERVVNRDVASVEAFLLGRRPRPHMAGELEL